MKRWKAAAMAVWLLCCGGWLCGCGVAVGVLPADAALPADGSIETEEDKSVYMALTFDDGPGEYTEALLDGLAERNVHATFFLIGKQVGDYEPLVRRMAEAGHQIGNHSYDHADLSALDCQAVLEDIARCDALLQTMLGEDSYWVRPPYGLICADALAALSVPLVAWSVDTEDWKSQNEGAILDHIYRDSFDGCIILLHDQYPSTVRAVLQAIDHLHRQGVRFVTVEELFALRGATPEWGKLYRKVPCG